MISQAQKVAFIGAQGVGKSTLSKLLSEHITDSVFVKEVVRGCPYGIDEASDFKTQWWILSHGILAEQEAFELNKQLIISDRCLIDAVVYTELIHKLDSKKITKHQRNLILQAATDWIHTHPYEKVFFVKVSPSIWQNRDLDDGFRSTSLEWFLNLEEMFQSAIKLLKIPENKIHIIQNDESPLDAFEQIQRQIGTFRATKRVNTEKKSINR